MVRKKRLLATANEVPLNAIDPALVLGCEFAESGGGEVKVELSASDAFVDNLDSDVFALV
jgi:hypothetical protein